MKDFEIWSKEKLKLEKKDLSNLICKKREIWLCKIGENIGAESSKDHPFIRPVLIVHANFGWDLVLIFPLTTKYNKTRRDFLFRIKHSDLKKRSYVMLNQIKVISKKRLLKKVVKQIDNKTFEKIKVKFKTKI